MNKGIRIVIAGAVVALASACSDTTGVQDNPLVEQLVTLEVYSVVADGVAQDLELMRDYGVPGAMGFGMAPGQGGPDGGKNGGPDDGFAPDCAFDGTTYTCTRDRMDDLQMVRQITFRDADGGAMEFYDALETASIEMIYDLEGTRSGDRVTATIDRHREKVVTGLEGEEETRTWNGSGESDVTRNMTGDDGAARSFALSATTLSEDVVMPVPTDDDSARWPLEGTITKNVEVTITTDGTSEVRTRTVVITFNGTQFADITIDGETGTIDLAKRKARRFARRHGQ